MTELENTQHIRRLYDYIQRCVLGYCPTARQFHYRITSDKGRITLEVGYWYTNLKGFLDTRTHYFYADDVNRLTQDIIEHLTRKYHEATR